MHEFLKQIKTNSSVAIFSTTIYAQYFYKIMQQERDDISVEFFINSFSTEPFLGKRVLTPAEAAEHKEIDYFLIVSQSSADIMHKVLIDLGIRNVLKLTGTAFETVKKYIKKESSFDTDAEFVPAGHYYSALPSDEDINEYLKNKDDNKFSFDGVDLNLKKQLDNLKSFDKLIPQFNFAYKKTDGKFFYLDNSWFSWLDAYIYASIIYENKPKKIIEIGSGFSTGLAMDVNREFFDNRIDIMAIEPNPERLKSVIGSPIDDITLYSKKLQDVDISVFSDLDANDILFIDSSHVAKINSDVLKIFFEILPNLRKGVIIHFHDIYNNFSYPAFWIQQKRCWNETFFLRAFLQYNSRFSIEFWNSFMKNYIKQNNIITNFNFADSYGSSIYLRAM